MNKCRGLAAAFLLLAAIACTVEPGRSEHGKNTLCISIIIVQYIKSATCGVHSRKKKKRMKNNHTRLKTVSYFHSCARYVRLLFLLVFIRHQNTSTTTTTRKLYNNSNERISYARVRHILRKYNNSCRNCYLVCFLFFSYRNSFLVSPGLRTGYSF